MNELLEAAKAVLKAFVEGHAGEEFDGEFSRVMAKMQEEIHKVEKENKNA